MSAEMSDYVAENKLKRPSGTHHSLRLQDQVRNPKLWPTPTATERSGINPQTGKGAGLWKTVTQAEKLWPTPNTLDGLKPKSLDKIMEYNQQSRPGRSYASMNLREQVVYGHQEIWPTPRAREGNAGQPGSKGSIHNAKRGYLDGMIQEQLPKKEKLWRTPSARDWKGGGRQGEKIAEGNWHRPNGGRRQLTLDIQVVTPKLWPTPIPKQFPTPTQRDWGGARKPETLKAKGRNATNSLPDHVRQETSGQLNPTWVEWLMGFPSGWTDLED